MDLESRLEDFENAVGGGGQGAVGKFSHAVSSSARRFLSGWFEGLTDFLKREKYLDQRAPRGFVAGQVCAWALIGIVGVSGAAYMRARTSVSYDARERQELVDAQRASVDLSKLRPYASLCERVSREEDVPLYILQGILLEGLSASGNDRRASGDYFGLCALMPTDVGALPGVLEDDESCLRLAARRYNEIDESREDYRIAIYFSNREELGVAVSDSIRFSNSRYADSSSGLSKEVHTLRVMERRRREEIGSDWYQSAEFARRISEQRNRVRAISTSEARMRHRRSYAFHLPVDARRAFLQTMYLKGLSED